MPIHPIKANRGYYTGKEFKTNQKDWGVYIDSLYDLEDYMRDKKLTIAMFYGTLLGIVREHSFISHDHDIDLIYISNYNTQSQVESEMRKLYADLLNDDMLIEDKRDSNDELLGQAHVFSPKRRFIFDLWTSYIDTNDRVFVAPFIKPICSKDELFPLKKGRLHNRVFNIPNDYNSILTYLYGNWKYPDPAGKPALKHGNILKC